MTSNFARSGQEPRAFNTTVLRGPADSSTVNDEKEAFEFAKDEDSAHALPGALRAALVGRKRRAKGRKQTCLQYSDC